MTLTPRRRKILKLLKGKPLTVREMLGRSGLSSTASLQYQLEKLAEAGFIDYAVGWHLTERGFDALDEK